MAKSEMSEYLYLFLLQLHPKLSISGGFFFCCANLSNNFSSLLHTNPGSLYLLAVQDGILDVAWFPCQVNYSPASCMCGTKTLSTNVLRFCEKWRNYRRYCWHYPLNQNYHVCANKWHQMWFSSRLVMFVHIFFLVSIHLIFWIKVDFFVPTRQKIWIIASFFHTLINQQRTTIKLYKSFSLFRRWSSILWFFVRLLLLELFWALEFGRNQDLMKVCVENLSWNHPHTRFLYNYMPIIGNFLENVL